MIKLFFNKFIDDNFLEKENLNKMKELRKAKNFIKIEKNIFILLSKIHLFFPFLFSDDLFSFLLSSNSYSDFSSHFPPSTILYFRKYGINNNFESGLLIIETLFYIYFNYYLFFNRKSKGIFIGRKGYIYIGNFSETIFDGKGIIIYSNGYIYFGEFKNGIPNGKGKLISPSGIIFKGEFKDGEKVGK
jgi:hypothetical protein